MSFQCAFMSKHLIANQTSKLLWLIFTAFQVCLQSIFTMEAARAFVAAELRLQVITAYPVPFQALFLFECTRALFAGELGLYSAVKLQILG